MGNSTEQNNLPKNGTKVIKNIFHCKKQLELLLWLVSYVVHVNFTKKRVYVQQPVNASNRVIA